MRNIYFYLNIVAILCSIQCLYGENELLATHNAAAEPSSVASEVSEEQGFLQDKYDPEQIAVNNPEPEESSGSKLRRKDAFRYKKEGATPQERRGYFKRERGAERNAVTDSLPNAPQSSSDKPVSITKMLRLMREFLTRVEQSLSTWDEKNGDPPCYWRIEMNVMNRLLSDTSKIYMLLFQHKSNSPFHIDFGLKPMSKAEGFTKYERKNSMIKLFCPVYLDDPQYLELVKVINEVDAASGNQPDRYMEEMEKNVVELDKPTGTIRIRFAPDDVNKDEKLITVFNAEKDLKTLIAASGGKPIPGDWSVKSVRHANFNFDMLEIPFVDEQGKMLAALPSKKAMRLESTKSAAVNLANYLAIIGPHHFKFHPDLKTRFTGAKPADHEPSIAEKEKKKAIEDWFNSNKNNLVFEPVEITILTGQDSTLIRPAYIGVVYTSDTQGFAVIAGDNGFAIGRFHLKKEKALDSVLKRSPFLDYAYTIDIESDGFYKFKIGSTEVAFPISARK